MHRLFTISEDTTAFPWAKRTPGSGVVAVIAVGIALLVGWLTGHTSAGAIAAGSAFTVGFAVFHEALASVAAEHDGDDIGYRLSDAGGKPGGAVDAAWCWWSILSRR